MTSNERNGSGAGGRAERDPRLDRAYRAGAREEPPAHLDAAILAAARREVGARPHAVSARLRAWRVPVSIAAVVVLSVSLVTVVREEGGGQLEQPTAKSQYAKPAETAPAAPADATEAAKAPPRAAPPAAAPAARDDVGLGATASAGSAGEAARREDQARPAKRPAAMELLAERPAGAAAPAPQPFQAPPAAPERRPALAADQAASAGVATPPAATRAGETETAATRAEPAPAPRSAAGMMQRDRAASEDAAGAVSGARPPATISMAEKPRPEARAQNGPKLADATRLTALMKDFDAQLPEKWLERIEALRREGRRADADELLAEFKRRFPSHPLPPGLR